LGSAVLVVPYLLSTTWPYPFNSLGLFGDAWWILGLTSLLGSILVLRALAGIFGFFWKARRAAPFGIDLEAALQVGADRNGEVGAILQGTREFYSVSEASRALAVRSRIWATILFLSAGVWIPPAWAISIFLATRGFLGPMGLWILTMGPALGSFGAGLVALGLEGTALNGARSPVLWNRWKNPGLVSAAQVWGEGLKQLRIGQGQPPSQGRRLNTVGLAAVAALAILTVIPATTFTLASSAGSILASMAVPSFSATKQRAASASALERYRLEADPEITPLQAGEALHALALAGRADSGHEWFKTPVRHWTEGFLADGYEDVLDVMPAKWHQELFPMAASGLTPDAEAYLRQVGQHPGLVEFETLARSRNLDALGARFVLPFPPEASALDIPVPRLTSVREAASAMVAKAVVENLDGHPDQAEATLRTALSAGLLLGAESPTLIDALVGYVIALNAGNALAGLFEVTGRVQEAEALLWVMEATQATGKMVSRSSAKGGVETALQKMAMAIRDEGELRGLRWEHYWMMSGLGPCLNPRQVAFGPSADQEIFMKSAHRSLVRYPAEEALWNLMNRGFFPTSKGEGWETGATKIMSLVLGPRAGKCVALLTAGTF
jgi:hypothetical protein